MACRISRAGYITYNFFHIKITIWKLLILMVLLIIIGLTLLKVVIIKLSFICFYLICMKVRHVHCVWSQFLYSPSLHDLQNIKCHFVNGQLAVCWVFCSEPVEKWFGLWKIQAFARLLGNFKFLNLQINIKYWEFWIKCIY